METELIKYYVEYGFFRTNGSQGRGNDTYQEMVKKGCRLDLDSISKKIAEEFGYERVLITRVTRF